jgi:hypothetical protein
MVPLEAGAPHVATIGPRAARRTTERAMLPTSPVSSPPTSRRSSRWLTPRFVLALAALGSLAFPAAADTLYPNVRSYTGYEGNATFAQYPPLGPRGFTSHDGVLLIQNGLPGGSLIIGRLSIVRLAITSETPGGPLGGETTNLDARIVFDMRGTGAFAGYARTIVFPVTLVLHTGPQIPGTSVRVFAVDVSQLQGQITLDPDFDLLRITAGTAFGMPSPGRAILTRDETGDFLADTWWDLTFRVDFVGHNPGPFAGLSGSTVSEHRQRNGIHTSPLCVVPDNGSGTADWTPFCTGWDGKTEAMIYASGAGDFLVANLRRNAPGTAVFAAGGPYGGETTTDTEILTLELIGEGGFSGYSRVLTIPTSAQHDLGPGMAGAPFQGRISEPRQLLAQIVGDPDFDLLRLAGGPGFSFTAAGHVTLTRDNADWRVDSFFDITYRVDMIGAAGGPFAGHSGSTNGDSRGQAGREPPGYCIAPDIGSGTATFPPSCPHGWRSPRRVRGLLDGMPGGSPVLADIEIVPLSLISSGPGGPLGGEVQEWNAKVVMDLTGVGVHAGYVRAITLPGTAKTATAPITLGSNPQHLETDLLELTAQLPPGDPDFDLLRITAGTSFGLASPGYLSNTHAGGNDWNVDSFFDIGYRIDFVGDPGGPFAGMSGSTTDRQRFLNGEHPTLSSPPRPSPVAIAVSAAMPNPTQAGTRVALALPKRAAVRAVVHDISGRLVRIVEDGTREPGEQAVAWDGAGASGARVRPGLYLLRLDVDGARFVRRVLVTR